MNPAPSQAPAGAVERLTSLLDIAAKSGDRSLRVEDLAAISTLLQAQAREAWQPIETAPKDGTKFIVLRGDGEMVVAWRHNPSSRTDDLLSLPGRWQQTGVAWMPLPTPPEAKP